MLRVRWPAWRALARPNARTFSAEASAALAPKPDAARSFPLLGHKGDLMLVHFRDFDELLEAKHSLAARLWDYLEQTTSYLSVVELGSVRIDPERLRVARRARHRAAFGMERGHRQTMARQRAAMHPRLFPEMPPHKFICFYPMDRRRGEQKNWYQLPMASASARCRSTARSAAATRAE